jgi:hypothetical protein
VLAPDVRILTVVTGSADGFGAGRESATGLVVVDASRTAALSLAGAAAAQSVTVTLLR